MRITLPEANSLIGKHFWEPAFTSFGELCRTPEPYKPCSAQGQGFTIVDIEAAADPLIPTIVRVRFDDGTEGYLPYHLGTEKFEWVTEDPEAADRARQAKLDALRADMARMERENCTGGALRIGMTRQQAVQAWCFPDHTNSTQTAHGTQEQWVYPGRGYLYFEGDRLTGIQRFQ
jgi:hypothetical protein